jgi:hypothetical protein
LVALFLRRWVERVACRMCLMGMLSVVDYKMLFVAALRALQYEHARRCLCGMVMNQVAMCALCTVSI